MGNGRNAGAYESNKWNIAIIVVFGAIVCGLLIITYCMTQYHHQVVKNELKIQELEERLENFNSEYTVVNADRDMIAFLQTETTTHREFIENQRNHLLWMVSVIVGIATFLLGFLGLSNRKEIKQVIDEQYHDEIQHEFDKKTDELLRGADKVRYLRKAVSDEERAAKKKVLFIRQKESNSNETPNNLKDRESMMEVYKFFTDELFYDFKIEEIDIQENIRQIVNINSQIRGWIDFYDIIVYQLHDDENEKKSIPLPIDKLLYIKLSEECERQKKYYILYSQAVLIKKELLGFRYSVANASITLIERIKTVLYL